MAQRMVNQPTAFATTNRRTKRAKVPARDAKGFKSFIHDLPCVICGASDIEAAHISYDDLRYGKVGRAGYRKEDDRWLIPLAKPYHDEQHSMNEREFWRMHEIDPVRVSAALWGCYTMADYESALLVIENARER